MQLAEPPPSPGLVTSAVPGCLLPGPAGAEPKSWGGDRGAPGPLWDLGRALQALNIKAASWEDCASLPSWALGEREAPGAGAEESGLGVGVPDVSYGHLGEGSDLKFPLPSPS